MSHEPAEDNQPTSESGLPGKPVLAEWIGAALALESVRQHAARREAEQVAYMPGPLVNFVL
jgi:hypothetical protein